MIKNIAPKLKPKPIIDTKPPKKFPERAFSRKPERRIVLMRCLVTNLIKLDRMRTTVAKAKELYRLMDHIVYHAKQKTPQSKEIIDYYIPHDYIKNKLREELVPRYKDRQSGVCRIWNAGFRPRDGADTAIIELVNAPYDMKEFFDKLKEEAKKKPVKVE